MFFRGDTLMSRVLVTNGITTERKEGESIEDWLNRHQEDVRKEFLRRSLK